MVLTQTTLGVDETRGIVEVLRQRFPDLELPPSEDICYATQNRQNAVKEMCARGMDLLLVVGSPNSSNAAHLVEVGQVRGVRGFLIDSQDDIRTDWLGGVQAVGVTGGASTPDAVVQAVVDRLMTLGGTQLEHCDAADENVEFQLPPILRDTASAKGAKTTAAESATSPAK
jgi:4-hydroxy-3-methylbut-2-enyl diphosphate reductase